MVFVVDGKKLAAEREEALKALSGVEGFKAKLVSIVLADDASGQLYTRLKKEAAGRIGVHFVVENVDKFSVDILLPIIEKYSKDGETHGIIIQRPGGLWRQLKGLDRSQFESDWSRLVAAIAQQKDVDGLRPDSKFTMATVKAVEAILESVKAKGKVVIVGSAGLVGRILVKKLKATGVDLETKDLAAVTSQADILISATGQAGLIKADMVKDGAVVIDVGWPKADVDFEAVVKKASVITPVPGGVGPLTVICLLENLAEACYSNAYHSHSGSSLD